MIRPEIDGALHQIVRSEVARIGCRAIVVGNASDHVHFIIQLASRTALATAVQRVKGVSSKLLRLAWQDGYFAESIGIADLDPLAGYITNQRTHHDASNPFELLLRRG